MARSCCKVVYLALILLTTVHYSSNKKDFKAPGHMKKLGSHRAAQGITMIGKFSTPFVFYEHFVKPGKPLWMRSALDSVDHPGLTKWNDTFLRMNYGNIQVKVEVSRKENRENKPTWLPFRQFLTMYKAEDLYMVHTLGSKMTELVLVPPSLQCGGFHRVIQEAVLWLGSGDAKSVLHYDELDNLLCLMDGQKDFVLIDKAYKDEVEADGFVHPGGYSLVDVDKVNLQKFPRLASVPWHEVHISKGDCLFIPRGWYHQVTSKSYRHMAMNFWFSHLYWFNAANCSHDQDFYKPLENIATFGFASPNEAYRSKLLGKLHDKGMMFLHDFVDVLDTTTKERRTQFFHAVDKYKDSVLSWSELYGFDIDKAIVKFPDIFELPGNPSSSGEEDIILYEPIVTGNEDDEDLEDTGDEEDSIERPGSDEQSVGKGLEVDGSDITNSDLDVASLPSPDEAIGDSFQTEPDNPARGESIDYVDSQENAQNTQHSTSGSDGDTTTSKSQKKDEL